MSKEKDFQKIKKAVTAHDKNSIHFPVDNGFYKKIKALLPQIQSPPTRPDGYVFHNGVLLVLEHFEIDCTERKDHMGSKQQFINDATEKELERQIGLLGAGMVVEEVPRSGQWYVESFTHAFQEHVAKINEYIDNVKKLVGANIKEVIVGFVIEDASKLGYYSPATNKRVDITNSKEFLDLFESAATLDFVLYTSTPTESKGYQVFLSKNAIKYARGDECEVTQLPEQQFTMVTYACNVYLVKDKESEKK